MRACARQFKVKKPQRCRVCYCGGFALVLANATAQQRNGWRSSISPALKSRTAAAINALCNEVFDKEALTNEFFKKLDSHIKAIESDLRGHQHMSGPEAFGQAQLLIERMIFLYFAQNRGWLNQQQDYLIRNFEPYRNSANGFGYYHEFLHRLSRTLSEPPPAPGDRLPGIPFLNGGLFDDDEFK